MKRALILITIASCGGSSKPAPQAPSNEATEPPVAMEEDVVAGEPNENAEARAQAIQAARDAGVIGGTATPPPQGPRDKASIRAVVRTHISEITLCYEKQLLASPGLAGTTTVKFTIDPNGTVSASTGAGFDPKVDTCVADVVRTMVFSTDAGSMIVSYPFKFMPSATSTTP